MWICCLRPELGKQTVKFHSSPSNWKLLELHHNKQESITLSCQEVLGEIRNSESSLTYDLLSHITRLVFWWWFNTIEYSKLRNCLTKQALFWGEEQKHKNYRQMKTWSHKQNIIWYNKVNVSGNMAFWCPEALAW